MNKLKKYFAYVVFLIYNLIDFQLTERKHRNLAVRQFQFQIQEKVLEDSP